MSQVHNGDAFSVLSQNTLSPGGAVRSDGVSPPATPTINHLLISGYNPSYALSGTASTASGAVTTLSYVDAQGQMWGCYVTPDASGNWSIGANTAFWHGAYDGSTTWGTSFEALVQTAGNYSFTATTTLGGVSVNDTSTEEVTKQDPPLPTVDAVEAVEGQDIILTGTGRPSAYGTVSVYGPGDTFLGYWSISTAADGKWSLNLSEALTSADQPPLSVGSYDIKLSVYNGPFSSERDATSFELEVLESLGQTNGADSLTGTEFDDRINLLAGDDTYYAGNGNDTITGGLGLDRLLGEEGDDTFIVRQGDQEGGESYSGGAGNDVLDLRGGGSFDLSQLSISGIEQIYLTGASGTTVTIGNFYLAQFINGFGQADVVRINDTTVDQGVDPMANVFNLLGRGVEQVIWQVDGQDAVATLLDADTMRVVAPNGVMDDRTYQNGVRIHQTLTDAQDAFDFDTVTMSYNAQGVITSRIQLNDNGVKIDTEFTDGIRTKLTQTDTSSGGTGQAWSSIVTTYAANGQSPETWLQKLDNGITNQIDYDSQGTRSKFTQTDASADGKAVKWQSIVSEYSSGGNLWKRTQTDDDGVETVTEFAGGGVRTMITQSDHSEDGTARSWSRLTTEFNGSGQIIKRTQSDDNGIETVTQFTNGVRTSIEQLDLSSGGSAATWSSTLRTWGNDGKLQFLSQTLDNGDIRQTHYVNGVVSAQSTYTDKTGSWTITGRGGNDTLSGGAGNDTLNGGAGNDMLYGSDGDDLLTGGLGADRFHFAGPAGDDRITDFGRGADLLDLNKYGIDSLADIATAGYSATQVGADTVIDLGVNGSITLAGFNLANLDDGDFYVRI